MSMTGLIIAGHVAKVVVRGNGKGMLAVLDKSNKMVALLQRVPVEYDRIIIATDDGYMSAQAMGWLAETGLPWIWLWRDKVVATSHPGQEPFTWQRQADVAPLPVMRYLLGEKLRGQSAVMTVVGNDDAAKQIYQLSLTLHSAGTRNAAMGTEGKAAQVYWTAWRGVTLPLVADDMLKVPPRWLTWQGRRSLVMESPSNRRATDPINAMLNYAYRVGETLCVQACYAAGISPQVSVMHHRAYSQRREGLQQRNSMALDLLEVIRPECDLTVLKMLDYGQGVIPRLRWHDFIELADGSVRIENPELKERMLNELDIYQDTAVEAAEKIREML